MKKKIEKIGHYENDGKKYVIEHKGGGKSTFIVEKCKEGATPYAPIFTLFEKVDEIIDYLNEQSDGDWLFIPNPENIHHHFEEELLDKILEDIMKEEMLVEEDEQFTEEELEWLQHNFNELGRTPARDIDDVETFYRIKSKIDNLLNDKRK